MSWPFFFGRKKKGEEEFLEKKEQKKEEYVPASKNCRLAQLIVALPVRRKSASNFVSEHFSSEKTYPHPKKGEKKSLERLFFLSPKSRKIKRFCLDKLILLNDEIQY